MTKNLNKSMKSKNDERYTPPLLIEPLLNFLPKENKSDITIWCPFDLDDSDYVLIFKAAGYNVINTHIDKGEDFFNIELSDLPKIDYIISNPPFSRKLEVFEKLYSMDIPFAMLMNIECLNYQVIGNFFLDKHLELLIFDKKVSFDGNTASFNSSYFGYNFFPKQLSFYHLPHNNTKGNFVGATILKNK